MNLELSKPTEDDIINNSIPDHLYTHDFNSDFGNGKFFQVVHDDLENTTTIKVASKTMLKIVYKPDIKDVEGFYITKLIHGVEKETLKLSKFNLAQIKVFLSWVSQFDLGSVSERKIKLADGDSIVDDILLKKLKDLFLGANGEEKLVEWIDEGLITSRDIVNTCYRKKQLAMFEAMMEQPEYWMQYCSERNIGSNSEERAWQHFFMNNEWIFGYGLDYRYNGLLQREAHLSEQDLDGSEAVISDFLLGDKLFTTFVEIKKPSTPLFGKVKNRSGSWCLSDDLIYAVSQILEQKASGQIKMSRPQYNYDGGIMQQAAYDSKVVLLIGHWRELSGTPSLKEQEIKKKTLELFRRDSRNIEILTYDELYERAKYIVGI